MSKHSVRNQDIARQVLLNIITFLTLLFLVGFGGVLSEALDLVTNPLLVIKFMCGCMILSNAILGWTIYEQPTVLHPSQKLKSSDSKVSRWLKTAKYLVFGILALHTVIVLFGAPILESISETFHLACLLACASVIPCLCVVGPSMKAGIKVWMSYCDSRENPQLFGALLVALCSVVGAWLGAFPIPLDWDRSWQVWPISCVIGTILGHCVGLIGACVCVIRDQRKKKRPKLV